MEIIEGITLSSNKDKLAIVVVGYNRLNGISRLLQSINNAYYDTEDVPLVISIDASGNQELYDYVKSFNWLHGCKYVNIQKERLGLKKHIFQCASLSKFFKGVVLLEDDLFVAPYYYHYSLTALNKYGDNDKVAGISLYAEEINGYVNLPFQPEVNQFDVFAWQTVSSWGEIWNYRMWCEFTDWLEKWNENFEPIDMIESIKNWTRAWSKYFYAFIIENNKYFIYPYQALSTNFNDAGGEHGGGNTSIVQVSLLQGKKQYQLGDFEELIKYDVYMQNSSIPQWLGIPKEDITIDFYGLKSKYIGHYILTPFELPFTKIKSYSLSMRPWELNIKYDIKGDDLYLYYRNGSDDYIPHKRQYSLSIAYYYLRGFNLRLLLRYVIDCMKRKIKK